MELVNGGTQKWPYLNQAYDFKDGKLWPNDRPGIGVEVDTTKLQQIGDFSERYTAIPIIRRPTARSRTGEARPTTASQGT